MIVQHTDKECKTKFSIGVEFNFLLKVRQKEKVKILQNGRKDAKL